MENLQRIAKALNDSKADGRDQITEIVKEVTGAEQVYVSSYRRATLTAKFDLAVDGTSLVIERPVGDHTFTNYTVKKVR